MFRTGMLILPDLVGTVTSALGGSDDLAETFKDLTDKIG